MTTTPQRPRRAGLRAGSLLGTVLALALAAPAHARPERAERPPVTWGEQIPDNTTDRPRALQALTVVDTVYFDEIPVPPGVTVTGVDLLPDGVHWLLAIEVAGAAQLAVMRPDGSAYRCVTCGLVDAAEKEEPLGDGRRIWFANTSGQSSGAVADFQWSVLECAPSVYDCAHREVLPVDFPIDSLNTLPQGAQNREATPDDRGEFVTWNEVRTLEGTRVTVAALVRDPAGYRLVDPRVVQPDYRRSDDPADWVNGGRFYEGGKFVLGNRYLKYQTTRTALNYDTGLLDLRTGRYKFMTRDLDYNETGEASPDGRWYSYSSARGLDRMDVFTQLVRPPYLDMTAFGQIGRVGLFGNRRCMNEAWLMDFGGQRAGGYGGQPLLTQDNWLARRRQWYPDSRTVLLTEQLLPNVAAGVPEGRQYRLRVVRLPGKVRKPKPERSLERIDWNSISVPADEYTGLAAGPATVKTIRGRVSGTARLSFTGTFASGRWEVRYRDYSDDGVNTISGTESISVPSAVGTSVWEADLRSTGLRNGFTEGRLAIDPRGSSTGTVTTRINGHTWSGVPQQADCPGMRQPELEVRIARHADGDRVIRVLARPAEDSRARPVQGARVRVADRWYVTDRRGRIHLRAGERGAVFTAKAGGFKTWRHGR